MVPKSEIFWKKTRGDSRVASFRLVKVPLFSGADPAFVNDVCTKLVPLNFPAHETIYSSGDLADEGTFLVCSGSVQLQRSRPDMLHREPSPREKPAHASTTSYARRESERDAASARAVVTVSAVLLKEGSLFGEGSALGCTRRVEDAIAKQSAALLTISGQDLSQALTLATAVRWRVLLRHVGRLVRFVRAPSVLATTLTEIGLSDLLETDESLRGRAAHDADALFSAESLLVSSSSSSSSTSQDPHSSPASPHSASLPHTGSPPRPKLRVDADFVFRGSLRLPQRQRGAARRQDRHSETRVSFSSTRELPSYIYIYPVWSNDLLREFTHAQRSARISVRTLSDRRLHLDTRHTLAAKTTQPF